MTLRENAGLVLVSRAERAPGSKYVEYAVDGKTRLIDPARAADWMKVKTPEWKAANQYRAKLVEKPERG